jgi:porphobilinogen synthase
LACETILTTDDLILPAFIIEGQDRTEPISSLPGVSRCSVDALIDELDGIDIPAVLLFGIIEPQKKDDAASAAFEPDGIVPSAVRQLKKTRPELIVITDICLCGYTEHGHCGLINDNGTVDNDRTLKLLAEMAVTHAQAGADMVAPSAMMDGQVTAIRSALDSRGLIDTAIMSYAAKFASSFYGPFRDAAQSAPAFGDRSSYQLPIGNIKEAIRDALLDESEGADWLMVKPAMPYLDVLAELKKQTHLPIAAYQVSGEYAMIKHASSKGVLQEQKAVLESLVCIKRAGANAIITYYAKEVYEWLKK